jgi:hypothetical protein
MTRARQIPAETLVSLRQRLDALPARCRQRRELIESTAHLFGVSDDTLYRALRQRVHLTAKHRSDCGKPRKLSVVEMERYCEVIAAFKVRTLNKKGRHVSTKRAIEILEDCGMRVNDEIVKPPAGVLTVPTVNRYLKLWGYDHRTLLRESPAARFQAEYSNQCWHFDLSPSDLKHLDKPPVWIDPARGLPTLMLYSVADDRSGVCYQEYHSVYGEDTEAALRFLFNAMSPKQIPGFPLQGIPETIYMDNGPIAKSRIFRNVMECLGVKVMTHPPKGADERKTTCDVQVVDLHTGDAPAEGRGRAQNDRPRERQSRTPVQNRQRIARNAVSFYRAKHRSRGESLAAELSSDLQQSGAPRGRSFAL